MREYIITVMCVSAVAAALSALCPSGEGEGLSKQMKIAAALAVTVSVISPLMSFIGMLEGLVESDFSELLADEGEKEEYESIFNSSYDTYEAEALKAAIEELLQKRFEIEPECLTVSLSFRRAEGERVLSRIYVVLSGSAIWKDTGEIESCLAAIYGCEVISAIG